MLKLNVGCGDVYLKDWINIDLDNPKADLKHDLREPLPYSCEIDCIYNEHVIEHFSVEEGLKVLSNFHASLKPGGILRIATLDLNHLVFRYIFNWKKQPWLQKYGYSWIKTRAEMLNIAMRSWNHKYVYNYEELRRRITEVGFREVTRKKIGKSNFSFLQNLETRKDSKLVVEAIK